MLWAFYFLGCISIILTFFIILQSKPVYALLCLIISFLSISGMFFILGAFFSAALEVIIYAGAIMLLFVFVIMMLNVRIRVKNKKNTCIASIFYVVSSFFSVMLLIFLVYSVLFLSNKNILITVSKEVQEVGISLFGPYLFIVELSSMLLLATLIVVYHIAREIKHTE